MTNITMRNATTTNPRAFNNVSATPVVEVSPPERLAITAKVTRVVISDIIAAPSMILPSLESYTSSFFRIWAAIPALVVISAVAMKSDAIMSPPNRALMANPAMNGTIIPNMAENIAGFPTFLRSDTLVSNPTVNKRKMTPNSAKSIKTLYPSLPASPGPAIIMPICSRRFQSPSWDITRFAAIIPKIISPIIPGRCSFFATNEPMFDSSKRTNSINTSCITSTLPSISHMIKAFPCSRLKRFYKCK